MGRVRRVAKAEDWPWSSAHVRRHGKEEQKQPLSPWPIPEPDGYRQWLIRSQPMLERTQHAPVRYRLCARHS